MFSSLLGFSPAPTHLYTSVNLPLTVPCSLASHLSWKQLKEKGIEDVHWSFTPKQSSPSIRKVLFNLSLEDPITLRPVQDNRMYPASDTTKGNLSLTKKQWKKADRGNYTCSMKFRNGETVSTTVQVKVLQSKSALCCITVSGHLSKLSSFYQFLGFFLIFKVSLPPL